MQHAGLVERRATLRATMEGQRETVEMVVVLCGNVTKQRIYRELFATVPGWVGGDGGTRGRMDLFRSSVQIRLSDQGELARHDYKNRTPDNPSAVCSFVRRQGFSPQRPLMTPTLRVESCRVETGPTPTQGPRVDAVAAAQARVGDSTTNNVVPLDESAVEARVVEEDQKHGAPGVPGSKVPPGDNARGGHGNGAEEPSGGAGGTTGGSAAQGVHPAAEALPDCGMFTATDLAERFHVPYDALRKRLERWRASNALGVGWVEDANAPAGGTRYIYELGAVRPVLDELLASIGASIERPSDETHGPETPDI